MKWKFMAKTVGLLMAMFGVNELPVNAEKKEMELTPEQEAMDRANNDIGIGIGKEANSWDDIVKKSREEMDPEGYGGGNGSVAVSRSW